MREGDGDITKYGWSEDRALGILGGGGGGGLTHLTHEVRTLPIYLVYVGRPDSASFLWSLKSAPSDLHIPP